MKNELTVKVKTVAGTVTGKTKYYDWENWYILGGELAIILAAGEEILFLEIRS